MKQFFKFIYVFICCLIIGSTFGSLIIVPKLNEFINKQSEQVQKNSTYQMNQLGFDEKSFKCKKSKKINEYFCLAKKDNIDYVYSCGLDNCFLLIESN